MPSSLAVTTPMAIDENGGKRGAESPATGAAKKTKSDGSNKKQVSSIRKQGELKGLLSLMLKAQLRSEQRHREVEGVIFDTFVGPAACATVLGGTKQHSAVCAAEATGIQTEKKIKILRDFLLKMEQQETGALAWMRQLADGDK